MLLNCCFYSFFWLLSQENLSGHLSSDPCTLYLTAINPSWMETISLTLKKHSAICRHSWRRKSHGKGHNSPPATNASSLVQFSHLCLVSSTACHYTSTVTVQFYQPEQKDGQEQRRIYREINQGAEQRLLDMTPTHSIVQEKNGKMAARLRLSCTNNYKPVPSLQTAGI